MVRRWRTPGRWFAWLFFAVAMLPLLSLAFLSATTASRAAEQQARARISASADASAAYVLEQFRGIERVVEATARRRSLVDAMGTTRAGTHDLPRLSGQLSEVIDANVGINDINLFDADGTLLYTYPPDPLVVGADFSYRDYFRGVRSRGRTYVSETYVSRTSGRHVVGVASPVRSVDGALLGVIMVQVEVRDMQAFVERFADAQDVSLMVTDQRGAPIAAEGGVTPREGPRDDDPRVLRALRGGDGVIERDGQLSAYRPIPELDWTISASIPARRAYQEASHAETLIVACAGLLAVVMAIALYTLLQRLHRYESQLREQVQAVERSNLLLEESNRQLTASNKALDTFSHTLVHDLRNPLTTIGGFARTLSSALNDDERLGVMATHIEQSATRMERLIGEVLELATIARVTPSRAEVDPGQVAREAAVDIDGLELELGRLPATVAANRAGLYRSFKNLLENAAAYGHDPEAPAYVRISADETPWHWRFFVDDRGPGVSPVDTGRIFSPFERGTQSTGLTGTGLGLSIVAACAESHGGSVHVEDAPGGVGARFVLTIAKPGAPLAGDRHEDLAPSAAAVDAAAR